MGRGGGVAPGGPAVLSRSGCSLTRKRRRGGQTPTPAPSSSGPWSVSKVTLLRDLATQGQRVRGTGTPLTAKLFQGL